MQRAVCGNTFAFDARQIAGGANLCGALSVRRARRICVGIHDGAGFARRPRMFRRRRQLPVFSEQIQNHAAGLRHTFACGPGNHRADGSRARAFRAPIVVLAKPAQHSRERKTLRADSAGFPDEQARAIVEQRSLQIAALFFGRSDDHDDRFCFAQHAAGRNSQRAFMVFEPRNGDAGAARSGRASILWRHGTWFAGCRWSCRFFGLSPGNFCARIN